jgi:hypothetical protein
MKINKIDKFVILLICLTFLVGINTIYHRINNEKAYKTAEFVIDYDEMEKFSESSDKDLSYWLNKFKGYGAYSVAVPEETIKRLIENGQPLKADIVSELVKNYDWQKNYPTEIIERINSKAIDNTDAIIATSDKSLYEYINLGLSERYDKQFYETLKIDDSFYIILNGTSEDLYYGNTQRITDINGKGISETKEIVDTRLFNIGVGYDEEKINLVKQVGLDVILRPINFPTYNEKLVDVYDSANKKYNLTPRVYLMGGKEVLGFPDNEDSFLNYVKENNIATVLIESANQREHLEQEGINKLVEKSNYNAVRAFTMWDYVRQRNEYYNYEGAEEIENTIFRAITERNIRLIYFKPFFEEEGSSKYLTDEAEYDRTFTSLSQRLKQHGIKIGATVPIEEFHIGAKRLSILAFGITLSAVFLFLKMFNIKHKKANLLYLASIPAALIPLVTRGLAEKGFGFLSAVVFSGLAILFFMTEIKKVLNSNKKHSNIQMMIKSAYILTVTIAISIAGAIFEDSMLADVKYFLEMDIFRGVKFAQILPFGIFLIIYLVYFMIKDDKNKFKDMFNIVKGLLNHNIKIYYAILAGIIGIIGYIYIARTGHETDIQPSNLEMIFRNFLENVLLARPRTKEFLIAFPAIFAAIYTANKKSEFFTFIFMLAAAIGTSSVINTFSHLRTPIYLSLSRTMIALIFGIVIGCILILLLNYIFKLLTKIQEKLQ